MPSLHQTPEDHQTKAAIAKATVNPVNEVPTTHDLSDPALHFTHAKGPVPGEPHYVTHESGPGGSFPFHRPIRCF